MPTASAQRAPATGTKHNRPAAPAALPDSLRPLRAAPAATGTSRRPCACGGTCPRCAQAARRLGDAAVRVGRPASPAHSLAVSQPGDASEREADQIAQRVLAVPDAAHAASAPPAAGRRNLDAGHLQAAPAHVRAALGSGGRALDEATRSAMEGRFGMRLDHVLLHSGAVAAQSAARLGARAYTLGQHIVLGREGLQAGHPAAQRLLAHELAHVVQQTGPGGGGAGAIGRRAMSIAPMIQRDLWIEPPHPTEDGRVLTADEIAAAITFNEGVLNAIPDSAGVIEMVRDVIGAPPTPAVIDQTFVEFVVDWQAAFGLTQDGKLGPNTARPLFREIGAEGAGQGRVRRGPRYATAGPINVAPAAAGRVANFAFTAELDSDPVNGVFPSCAEVRQDIQWDAPFRTASIAAGNGNVPHGGFPATTPAGRFLEDRDAANHRYGHRSGSFADPQTFDQYLDNSGLRNQAFGHLYRGSDSPGGPTWLAGSWTFRLRVVDVCNGDRTLATSARLVINWL